MYATLRARSAAMRTATLNDEIVQANSVGERMTIPGSLLGVIFLALLVALSYFACSRPRDTEGHHQEGPKLKALVLLQIAAPNRYDDLRRTAPDERGS